MKVFVLAGNYAEFTYYFPERDKDVIYLCNIEQIYGCRNFKIKRVGTWGTRDINFLHRVATEEAYL